MSIFHSGLAQPEKTNQKINKIYTLTSQKPSTPTTHTWNKEPGDQHGAGGKSTFLSTVIDLKVIAYCIF